MAEENINKLDVVAVRLCSGKGKCMKKVLLLVVLILLVSATAVYAAEPREGIRAGLITGLPFHIGVSGEYNFGQATASVSLGYASAFLIRIGGDYNFDKPFVNDAWGMALYLSVGGHLDLLIGSGWNTVALGIPVTWSYYLDDLPMKIFVKAGPEIYFGLGGGLDFLGTIGALYQF